MNTHMLNEARQAPAAVAALLATDAAVYDELGARLRAHPPLGTLTIARGSSDHAASFMAYLTMARLGRLVTSLPMSLLTLYPSRIISPGLLSIAFSQSGQSPDLVLAMRYLREHGACTAAFVNDEESPLAQAVQCLFPLHAGKEGSVAATKSFITQLVAGARLVAAWEGASELEVALKDLPRTLEAAAACDWSSAVDALKNVDRLLVIGRGTGLPVALEAALKLKETCGLQAEAFSGAEVKHGPMALIGQGYPLLIFAPRGPAQASLLALADEMRARGAAVLLAAPAGTQGSNLPIVASATPDLDPISMVQSFYVMVEALARARGFDPDRPPYLAKVTRTQ